MIMFHPYTDKDILSCDRNELSQKGAVRQIMAKTTRTSGRHADICTILSTNYNLRHTLQKTEFATCWILLLVTVLTNTVTPLSVLYMKVSLFTRVLAYAFDFANAWVKRNHTLPMWLILHHSGVTVQHFTKAFFLTPNDPLQAVLFLLASQSSHNTWTKRLSLLLYWGNVLVGVLTCRYLHNLHDSGIAGVCFGGSLVVTSVGILLLVSDSMMKKYGKRVWSMEIRK